MHCLAYSHAGGASQAAVDVKDPYANDPARHPALMPRTIKPYNGETPNVLLTSIITPTEIFFTRNHLPVPAVDPTEHK